MQFCCVDVTQMAAVSLPFPRLALIFTCIKWLLFCFGFHDFTCLNFI